MKPRNGQRVKVKPITRFRHPDRKGPDGRNAHLAEAGEVITWATFWTRRLNDGDVEVLEIKE